MGGGQRALPLPAPKIPPLPSCGAPGRRAQADTLGKVLGGSKHSAKQAPPPPHPCRHWVSQWHLHHCGETGLLGPPGEPPASIHAAGSATTDPASALATGTPSRPRSPAVPLRSHHPSAPQGPQLPSPGAQSLQTHPGGVPVSSPPVQSRCSQGPSESKQTLWSASAAPGHPPACPRERRRYGLHSHVTLVGREVLFPSTWWGGGRGSSTRQHLHLSLRGRWGSRGQPQTLGRG